MAITTSCPNCQSLFRLADELAGEQVRCQKCARLFEVPKHPGGPEGLTAASLSAPEPAPVEVPAPAPVEAYVPPMIESPAEKPPTASAAPEPAPPAVQALPRPAPPASVPSARTALALLGVFVLTLVLFGGFASIWVGAHLKPVTQAMVVAPSRGTNKKDGVRFNQLDRDLDRRRDRMPLAAPMLNEGARTDARLEWPAPGMDHRQFGNQGPYRAFRVSLAQGAKYHFYVSSNVITPVVEIWDGDFMRERHQGGAGVPARRFLFTFQAPRTAEFHVIVKSQEQLADQFSIEFSRSIQAPAFHVRPDKQIQGAFQTNDGVRVQDPLDPIVPRNYGPYREYLIHLEANKEYRLKLTSTSFMPVLRILNDQGLIREHAAAGLARKVDVLFRAPETRAYRIRVTSNDLGIGAYTFGVQVIGGVPQLQRIISVLDQQGKYEEQRALTDSDPVEPNIVGAGPYKQYRVTLQKGNKYRVEMSSKEFLSSVRAFDPDGNALPSSVKMQTATIVIDASQTGDYRLHAAAAQPHDRGAFTFRIERVEQ